MAELPDEASKLTELVLKILDRINANPESAQLMDVDLSIAYQRIFEKAVLKDTIWDSEILKEANYEAKDNELRNRLTSNVAEFSAAKTYAQIKEFIDIFKSGDNNIKFSDFKRQALEINEVANVVHLRTEFNDAVASGQMAAQYARYDREKDVMPYLTYNTVGDDRVRDRHADLDGITLPIDHPFWDQNMPINGHNCRCDVSQSNDPNKVTPDSAAEAASKRAKIPMKFQNNSGKTGVAFTKEYSHLKDVDIDTLKREDYAGLKSIDEIYKKSNQTKLGDAVQFNTAWDALKKKRGHKTLDAVVLKDRNANLMLVSKKATGNSQFVHQLENTLTKPNEIWVKGNKVSHIKYFDKGILIIQSDRKAKASKFIRLDAGDTSADTYRAGAILYKR